MVIGIGARAAIQGAVNGTIAAQNARKKIEEEKKEKEQNKKEEKKVEEKKEKMTFKDIMNFLFN